MDRISEKGRLSRPGPAGISVRSLAYSWPTAQPSSHLASNLIERPRLLPMHTCPCGYGWLAQTCGVIIVLTYSSACFLFLTDVKVWVMYSWWPSKFFSQKIPSEICDVAVMCIYLPHKVLNANSRCVQRVTKGEIIRTVSVNVIIFPCQISWRYI